VKKILIQTKTYIYVEGILLRGRSLELFFHLSFTNGTFPFVYNGQACDVDATLGNKHRANDRAMVVSLQMRRS